MANTQASPGKTLIVEADDARARRYSQNMDQFFPDAINVRATSIEQALDLLRDDGRIFQVCIGGIVFKRDTATEKLIAAC